MVPITGWGLTQSIPLLVGGGPTQGLYQLQVQSFERVSVLAFELCKFLYLLSGLEGLGCRVQGLEFRVEGRSLNIYKARG